ncbi:hypothetical protein MTBSS4_50110 [Magnetospirillum sp. SS-4]|nr:hypothetical protein MTBSS4_50110 [Magnetospirillum sp. SS-4]
MHPHIRGDQCVRRASHVIVRARQDGDGERGRGAARPRGGDGGARTPCRARRRHGPALSGRHGGGGVRHGVLLGSRAAVLADARGPCHLGRLCRRLYAKSHL